MLLAKFFVACFILLMVFVSSAICQQDEFLAGYWSFDEDPNDAVIDQSGNGNDGTINGEVDWIEGKFGKAIEFASGANVLINDSDTLRDMEAYTIAMWIKMNELSPDWNHLFEKDGSYGITINSGGGDFRFTPNSGKVWMESGVKVKEGVWYYITMTAADDTITFYVDAKKEADGNEAIVFNDSPVNIAHGPSYPVNGAFDEVKMWSIALNADEIKVAMEGNLAVMPLKDKVASTWAMIKHDF